MKDREFVQCEESLDAVVVPDAHPGSAGHKCFVEAEINPKERVIKAGAVCELMAD